MARLKKYLLDFSNIEDKTTEIVKIWNHYLTYSIVFDIDSVSSKEINDIFKEDVYNNFSWEKLKKDVSKIETFILPQLTKDSNIEQEILEESKKYNLD